MVEIPEILRQIPALLNLHRLSQWGVFSRVPGLLNEHLSRFFWHSKGTIQVFARLSSLLVFPQNFRSPQMLSGNLQHGPDYFK